MATPYNPFSPPPTAGPLSIIERANQNTPYSGGGGGGGGGTSTISTFNQLFTSSIGSANPVSVDLEIVGNGANLKIDMSSGGLADIQFQMSTSVGSGGGNAPSLACLDLGGQNYSFVLGAPAGVGMTTTISSLSVSSINGAAPGGGSVPANLELSTLTMGIPGVITGVSSLVGGGGILSVGDQLAVSSISGLGNALLLDGAGYAINVAGSAVNIGAAPVNISSATISSINGLAPGAVPNPLSVSSLSVSSLNGGVPAVFQFQPFTTYTQGANSCVLGPSYYSLVNGVGNLVLTFPETPGASWAGANKYITFGTNFNSGGMPSTWHFDNVSISCPDATGAYALNSWISQVGGNQLTFNLNVGGSPSTFAITAQVRSV